MGISREDEEATYLKLFPFSLIGKDKIWLESQPNQSFVNWEDMERKFLFTIFPIIKICMCQVSNNNFFTRTRGAFM